MCSDKMVQNNLIIAQKELLPSICIAKNPAQPGATEAAGISLLKNTA